MAERIVVVYYFVIYEKRYQSDKKQLNTFFANSIATFR